LLCSWLVQASLLGAWIYCLPGPRRRRLDAGAGSLDDAAMSRLDAGACCLDAGAGSLGDAAMSRLDACACCLDAGAGCLDDAGAGCLDGLPGYLRGPPGTFWQLFKRCASQPRGSLWVGRLIVWLFFCFCVILWNHGLPLMFRCMLVVTNKL
jgi:hypothetical protein